MSFRRTVVGELRPSQLLHTFGIGSIVDLPHLSVLVTGLEDWPLASCRPIQEDRLLEQVRRRLGPQVQGLYSPPLPDENDGLRPSFSDANHIVGVPVAPFPRWMRCPFCHLLAPLKSGLFLLKAVPGRPDLTKYVHGNCNKATQPSALPARFLLACEAGHLDDFPWDWFVRHLRPGCNGVLELQEYGVSGEAAEVEVSCRECGARQRMAEAFGRDAPQHLPQCRGRRPQLRDFEAEPCRAPRQTILLGASNAWFAATLSTLYVPEAKADQLAKRVEEHWSSLSDADEVSVLRYLRKQGKLAAFADVEDAALLGAISAQRKARETSARAAEDLKTPEWRVFSRPDPALNGPDFELREVGVPSRWGKLLKRVVLAERLREVTALTAFTRIASSRDYAEGEEMPAKVRAPISRSPPTFVPAAEVRGEGIFLQFDEEELNRWATPLGAHSETFLQAHTAWRRRRAIDPPEAGFPGLRYVVLHSFAHALMRGLSLECGYGAASLRERIYARDDGDDEGESMAGVLIYTAAPDSEGTLGGLVRMGMPDELGRHIDRALRELTLCSSDPLCADHAPDIDGTTLHGACCHACLFAPETSCERGNRYLDRTLLVETVRSAGVGLFTR